MNGTAEPSNAAPAAEISRPSAEHTEEVRKLQEENTSLQKAATVSEARASQQEKELANERTKAERAHVISLPHSWNFKTL